MSFCVFLLQAAVGQSNLVNLSNVDIPYQKFVLDNGLTLIVHEDHKAPIVCVNIWYHVGSKNEKPGKSGFAHLFEHLMFNGSEHFNTDYFKALESIGATDLNGTTNTDRTNYFQNIPLSAFDQVLWLESDRMGHLLGVIDQPRLDEQRGVVQNEKRQGVNQPYGREWEMATGDLRKESGVADRQAFTKGIDELQAAMIVMPSEVLYSPKFTYIWTLAVGRFPDALRQRIKRDVAVREIARCFLAGAGITIPGELARVTGLSRPEAGLGNRALVKEGFADMIAPGFYELSRRVGAHTESLERQVEPEP